MTTESPVRTNQHFAQDRKEEIRKNVRKNVRTEDRIRSNFNQDRKPTLAPFLSEAR